MTLPHPASGCHARWRATEGLSQNSACAAGERRIKRYLGTRARVLVATAAAVAGGGLAVSQAGCATGSSTSEARGARHPLPTTHHFDVARAYALVRLQLS